MAFIFLLLGLSANLVICWEVSRFTKAVNQLDYLLQQCGMTGGIAGLPAESGRIVEETNKLLSSVVLTQRRSEIEEHEAEADKIRTDSRALKQLLCEEFGFEGIKKFAQMFVEAERQLVVERTATGTTGRISEVVAKIGQGV